MYGSAAAFYSRDKVRWGMITLLQIRQSTLTYIYVYNS